MYNKSSDSKMLVQEIYCRHEEDDLTLMFCSPSVTLSLNQFISEILLCQHQVKKEKLVMRRVGRSKLSQRKLVFSLAQDLQIFLHKI